MLCNKWAYMVIGGKIGGGFWGIVGLRGRLEVVFEGKG